MTIKEQLDQNIPGNVITTRTQSGKNLSYLEGWYVIDRLNQVLGTESWNHEILEIKTLPVVNDKQSFLFHVRLTATIDGKITVKDGIGFGSDKTGFNAGEMAAKEAETDALKRAAMKLGRSLGLALYDKSGEYVDETPKATAQTGKTEVKPQQAKPSGTAAGTTEAKGTSDVSPATASKVDTKTARQKIKSAFAVLEAQKKVTKKEFVDKYLGGGKVDTITDDQVGKTLNQLKTSFPELSL